MAELGSMAMYAYGSDDGNTYSIRMHTSFATASGLSVDVAGSPSYPRRWVVRHCFIERTDGSTHKIHRKKIPCSAAKFASAKIGDEVTIDTLVYVITGFLGERRSR